MLWHIKFTNIWEMRMRLLLAEKGSFNSGTPISRREW